MHSAAPISTTKTSWTCHFACTIRHGRPSAIHQVFLELFYIFQVFFSASESILPKPYNCSTSTTSVNKTDSDKLLCYLEVELPLGEDRTTDSDNEDITEKRWNGAEVYIPRKKS
jgi:hypothetical protein